MDMFKPNLKITIDPNQKTYTVDAKILAPNSCYLADGAVLGAPAGQVVIPEAEPITLKIIRRGVICTEAVKTLEYCISDIPLTQGKSRVIAFSEMNGEVLGVGAKPIPSPDGIESSEGAEPSSAALMSVSAWVDAMPPGPSRLIVIMTVWAPCMNYEFVTEDMGSFGFTGRALRVKLTAKRPDVCMRGIYSGPVRFERELERADQFDDVAVQFEGDLIFDPLEIIS